MAIESKKEIQVNPILGMLILAFGIGILIFAWRNSILLNKSTTYVQSIVKEIRGSKNVVLEYYHPQEKRTCYCNGGRVHDRTAKIGNMVIIRLHPYYTSVCKIDWKKTREYYEEHEE